MGFPEFDFPDPVAFVPTRRNLFRKAFAKLTSLQAANASEDVIYVDRAANRIACVAMLGSKLLRIADEMGAVRIEWTDMDFLIPASYLVVGDQPFTPTRGDQIIYTIGDDVQTFEVAPYGNDPCWRYTDPFQTMIRVHTKLLEIEPYS